jgi:hypothetical protein
MRQHMFDVGPPRRLHDHAASRDEHAHAHARHRDTDEVPHERDALVRGGPGLLHEAVAGPGEMHALDPSPRLGVGRPTKASVISDGTLSSSSG